MTSSKAPGRKTKQMNNEVTTAPAPTMTPALNPQNAATAVAMKKVA